ncbi:LacI family DNA-binding transcriptional regulator [Pseudoxanthomonas sp. z9]|uniref:LacI family DNA-binding transcriptional regulator n=1 Tax=Pseudoxanthomonas sp. z9 TaxID=2584942 RepID=UPI00114272BE|nr:LacI family DNA-binding transcriptional regulator [Pseudoxanthomonas sp. z9]MCL6713016.1 LacI family DNA-binding transcriptional regulator [Pseudomonas sp. R2.Fl]
MRIRIEDVAAAAGVSMKTVSRVLNHEPNVREETRRRVEDVVARLQYRPNPSARSLAGQRSYVVALAYDNPSRNYLMEIQSGVLEACRAQHYTLVLAPVTFGQRGYTADITSLVEHFGLDGVLLIPPLTDDKALLAQLEEHEIPFASISPRVRRGRIGVTVDEHAAVCDLVAELVALGHRRIGHIKGHKAHGACAWRFAGYRDALERAGIDFDPDLVVEGEFTYESGVHGANQLLDLKDPPTAIFAANDDTAAGVIRVAGLRGLNVPRDLSVCGFDDTPISRHIFPALTTVRQPTRDMGRVATLELLNSIRDPDAGRMVPIQYSLELRESIAPPRRKR